MPTEVPPTLVIGLGGTGTMTVSEIKRLAHRNYLKRDRPFPLLRFLAIDTEFLTSSKAEARAERYKHTEQGPDDHADSSYEESFNMTLSPSEKLLISYDRDNMVEWLKDPSKLNAEDFVAAEHLEEVRRAAQGYGAGGYGIIGKMALWANLNEVATTINKVLTELNNAEYVSQSLEKNYRDRFQRSSETGFNVYVIGSMGGGTGKGTYLTIGAIVTEELRKMQIATKSIRTFVNFLPSCFTVSGRNVGNAYLGTLQANQYASYKELEHVLLHGYPLEAQLKSALGLSDNRKITKEIYNTVFNISAQQGQQLTLVGDYATINRALAETILGMTFGGLSNDYRAYLFSNKEAFVRGNPTIEAAARTTTRKRDYGRIGRYKLVYPIDQLFRYAQDYYTKEILGDIINGSLSPVASTDRKRPEQLAEEVSTRFIPEAEVLVQPLPFYTFESLALRNKTFEDPWVATMTSQSQGAANALQVAFQAQGDNVPAFKRAEALLVERTLKGDLDQGERGFVHVLQQYVKDYGLNPALLAVSRLMDNIAADIQERFRSFMSKLPGASSGAEFEFTHHGTSLLDHLNSRRRESAEALGKYADGTSDDYGRINTALAADREVWHHQNDKLFKNMGLVEKGPKTLKQAEGALRQAVANARQAYAAAVEANTNFTILSAHMALYRELEEYYSIMVQNARLIESRGTQTNDEHNPVGGLLSEYANRLAKIVYEPRDALELRVFGATEADFTEFARNLRFTQGQLISDKVQDELNLSFMDRLVTEQVTASELVKVVEAQTLTVQELRKEYNICSFLAKDGREHQTEQAFNLMLNRADLLGPLAPGKVKGGDARGHKMKLLQLQDVNLLGQFRTVFKEELKTAETNNKEEIILTAFETALPLFVFAELYECQARFQALGESDADVDKRYSKHTHKDFIDIPEPIGAATPIPLHERPAFINMLQHFGILQIDEYGDLQIAATPDWQGYNDAAFTYLLDARKNAPEHESRVNIRAFVNDINERGDWFDTIAKATHSRMLMAFEKVDAEVRAAREAELAKYFKTAPTSIRHDFPYVPESIIIYVRANTSHNHQGEAMKSFLDKHVDDNAYKRRQHIKGHTCHDTLFRSLEKLHEVYPAAKLSIFEDIGGAYADASSSASTHQVADQAPAPPASEPTEPRYYTYSRMSNTTSPLALPIRSILDQLPEDMDLLIYQEDEWVVWREIGPLADAYDAQMAAAPPPPPPPA